MGHWALGMGHWEAWNWGWGELEIGHGAAWPGGVSKPPPNN